MRICTTWTGAGVRNAIPRIATIDAPIAKYITIRSDCFARISWTSIPFSSAATSSCRRSPSTVSGPTPSALPRLRHQFRAQYPYFSRSPAEIVGGPSEATSFRRPLVA